jgi:predicted house-cleaning noncanonical NTP pyrophosphatase (MazG superfamily)
MLKQYNKLVRDKILEIIKKSGSNYKYHIAKDDTEYLEKLYEKLQEEINEFKDIPSIEEFADILEVLEALAKFYDFHQDRINEAKLNKKTNRGCFDNRIILEKSMKKLSKVKANTLKVKKEKTKKQRKLDMLDDDNDIPVVRNSESISSYENRTGHGFWGNPSTGYIYDKDNK